MKTSKTSQKNLTRLKSITSHTLLAAILVNPVFLLIFCDICHIGAYDITGTLPAPVSNPQGLDPLAYLSVVLALVAVASGVAYVMKRSKA